MCLLLRGMYIAKHEALCLRRKNKRKKKKTKTRPMCPTLFFTQPCLLLPSKSKTPTCLPASLPPSLSTTKDKNPTAVRSPMCLKKQTNTPTRRRQLSYVRYQYLLYAHRILNTSRYYHTPEYINSSTRYTYIRSIYLFSKAYNELSDLPDVDDILGILLTGVDDLRAPRHLCAGRQTAAAARPCTIVVWAKSVQYHLARGGGDDCGLRSANSEIIPSENGIEPQNLIFMIP